MSLTLGAICIAPAVRFQSLVRTCGQNGHMETVLVVDDEPTCRVRKFIRPFSGASGGGSRIFELGFSFPIWWRAPLVGLAGVSAVSACACGGGAARAFT